MTVMKRRDMVSRWLLVATLAVTMAACAVTETRHGHLLPKGVAEELSGADVTQARVIELLGTPSTISAFDRDKWFYVSEVTQHFAFFKPDVVAREVLILEFDRTQTLKRVATLSEEDGQEVTLVSRETTTEGNKISIMEQLLGNIGKFNPAE
jgi:outer membrane protein assembly factor BamE (lipoprotein component of BamABCDE complex)